MWQTVISHTTSSEISTRVHRCCETDGPMSEAACWQHMFKTTELNRLVPISTRFLDRMEEEERQIRFKITSTRSYLNTLIQREPPTSSDHSPIIMTISDLLRVQSNRDTLQIRLTGRHMQSCVVNIRFQIIAVERRKLWMTE